MGKAMMSRKWKKIAVILSGMFGLATLSFNCSPTLFESAKGSGGSGGALGAQSFGETNAPLTLFTAEQTYQSMLNVTGQSDAPVSRTEYLARFGTMSSTSSLTNLNSPLMLASTSLAGDICNNMFTKEAATNLPWYFGGVAFNAAPNHATYQAAMTNLARGFWGRNITGDELAALDGFYSEMTSGATQNSALTRAVFVGACAAMLSSFDSLVY